MATHTVSVCLGLSSSFRTIKTTSSVAVPPSSSSLSVMRLPYAEAQVDKLRTVTYATVSQPSSGKRRTGGIMKPKKVSPEMHSFLGLDEISRAEALKLIWAYIKQNELQDPENKKIIVCDEKLKTIFAGKDRVGFLEVGGLITPHFLK